MISLVLKFSFIRKFQVRADYFYHFIPNKLYENINPDNNITSTLVENMISFD